MRNQRPVCAAYWFEAFSDAMGKGSGISSIFAKNKKWHRPRLRKSIPVSRCDGLICLIRPPCLPAVLDLSAVPSGVCFTPDNGGSIQRC